MEHFIFGDEQIHRDHQSGQLRCCNGQPDALDPEYHGQQDNCRQLEQQGAQERDQRARHTVAQGREERRAVDVEAHDEETQAIHAEGMAGQLQQLCIIAHKDLCHIGDNEHGHRRHDDRYHADEPQTLGIEIMHLGMVPGTVVVADDGSAAHGIAHEDRHKQERRVHDDAISRHTVLACKAEELVVVEDVDQ